MLDKIAHLKNNIERLTNKLALYNNKFENLSYFCQAFWLKKIAEIHLFFAIVWKSNMNL